MAIHAAQDKTKLWIKARHDALWQLAERGVRTGLGFVLSIMIARELGPTLFGVYSYALATVALFAFLGQAGLEALLVRELIREPLRATFTLSEGFVLRLGGAGCAAIGAIGTAILAASNKTHGATLLVCIMSISGLLQAGYVAEALLQANRKFAGIALAKVSAYGIAGALRIVALFLPSPLLYLAFAAVAESLLCFLLLWWVCRRQLAVGLASLHKPKFGRLMAMTRLAMPLLLSAFTVAVYSRIDVFMTGRMLGSEASGIYTAGTLLSEGFYIIPTAMMAAAAPRLAKIYLTDIDAFHRELQHLLRLLSLAGIGIAMLVTFLAPYVLPLLFGARFDDASSVLQVHIWSTWAVFLSAASDPYYINHDLRRLYLLKTSTAAILNVLLNFMLIPRLGVVGAAWATLAAYTASAVLVGALSRETRPLFKMQLRAITGLPLSEHTP